MPKSLIHYEKSPVSHIARVTFRRPEKLNAFTLDMYRDLATAIRDADHDDAIKVVILRGEGRAFSTGQDLEEVGFMYGFGTGKDDDKRRPSIRRRLAVDREWAQNLAAVAYSQKITIAQVHGHCLGSGFDIFLACDLSVVADDAILGHPGRRLVGPGLGFNTYTWFWKLGPTLAKHMAITGDTITGLEAREWRITGTSVPATDLESTVEELAARVAKMPGDGIVMGKASFQLAADIAGVSLGYSYGYLMHTLGTNIRFDPDEHNFFRARREKGAHDAFHERDERFVQDRQKGTGEPLERTKRPPDGGQNPSGRQGGLKRTRTRPPAE